MRRIDIMLDIETLGTRPGSVIFQVAGARFDITTGQVFEKLNTKLDIESCDIQVDGRTLKWWLNTNHNLLKELLLSKDAENHLVFKQKIIDFLKPKEGEKTYLWGKGILFDNAKIKDFLGSDYPVEFRNDRDVRTILELASMRCGLSEKELEAMSENAGDVDHDAFSDVLKQVRLVHLCYQNLMS